VVDYETSPPRETTSDLADFHQRQGHAPRFAGKGREMAPGLRRMARYEGRSAGRGRASSRGVKGWILPPGRGERGPPSKTRTALRSPLVFPARVCRSRASNRAFFALVFEVALRVTDVTSPPSETAPDLADFHPRQGHAPRFAGKGGEIGPALRSDRTLPKPTCVARCLRSSAPPLRVT
jgi:hypothetical protein